jgi:hypothetical protein
MSIASSIPTIADALLTLLNAATWPTSKPQISDSDPDQPGREIVIVGDTYAEGEDSQEWSAVGARTRDERYTIRLDVKVLTPGLTVTQARNRAFALFSIVEQTLIENVTAAVSSTPSLQVVQLSLRQPTHRQGAIAEGQGCVIESGVRVHARLRR